MSDPIRSISQNNFILADQQAVNHDNTLTGDGTADSPLGLNETVLWSGDKTGTGTITLSEAANNFERMAVYIASEALNVTAPQRFESLVEFGEWNSQLRFVLRYGGVLSKSLVASENSIYVWGGELVIYDSSYTTLNVGRTNRAHVHSITNVIDHSDLTHIRKIVGINRIANN